MTQAVLEKSTHTFHIPVMGTGFSIDTPLKVARYGISSVISLADDILIEQMRKVHCERSNEPYTAIDDDEEDCRARRITAYLNLLQHLIQQQAEALQKSPFETASEITKYFEMLPDSPLRRAYNAMLVLTNPTAKASEQNRLRKLAIPGRIDVNIMTKLDRVRRRHGKPLPPQFCDAMAALRGYANSSLNSALVFSAGMNPRLYSYAAQFADFFADDAGLYKKKIVIKVSDYRSAVIQGRFLAKRGLWVSEYRVESGLNCGGHAFATKGLLIGPILEEFKRGRTELQDKLFPIYVDALAVHGKPAIDSPPEVRITAQGGIGTGEEDNFLRDHYGLDGTGWGSPFLLTPDVTNVDDAHLKKLAAATAEDVYLSDCSPLGIPFWSLRSSSSERVRHKRILAGRPGSPCPKGYLAFNTEFTGQPVCSASRAYQRRKLANLPEERLTEDQLPVIKGKVVAKACICHDLAAGATIKNGIDPHANTVVCCGPNIVGFSKTSTLEELVGHIYGRLSLLESEKRPHMFIRELSLYVEQLRSEIQQASLGLLDITPTYFREFKENLLQGIDYYRRVAEGFVEEKRNRFVTDLQHFRDRLETLVQRNIEAAGPAPP